MMKDHVLTRRLFLGLSSATIAAAASAIAATGSEGGNTTQSAVDAEPEPEANFLKSHNGWPVEYGVDAESAIASHSISGIDASADFRIGPAAVVLLSLVRRLHYEVSLLEDSDISGWEAVESLSLSHPESNLASGTAVRIRSGAPSDQYYAHEEEHVRSIVESYKGVIQWGGEFSTPDQSFFFIGSPPRDQVFKDVVLRLRRNTDLTNVSALPTVEN